MSDLRTQYVGPPIPSRNFDWQAWRDGDEEQGPIGYGPTEEAAIARLKEMEECP